MNTVKNNLEERNLGVRAYVEEYFRFYPNSTRQFPVTSLSSLASFEGEAAKKIIKEIDELALDRFLMYKQLCSKTLDTQVYSEPKKQELIESYRREGQQIGRNAGPWAGATLGGVAGYGGGRLLTSSTDTSFATGMAFSSSVLLISKIENKPLQLISAAALTALIMKQDPSAITAEIGILLSTRVHWPARIGEEIGGRIGEVYGRIVAWMHPPQEGRDLSRWKLKICEFEEKGLNEDANSLNKFIDNNKEKIREPDLKKLNFIRETLINRAEVVAKLYEELKNESTTH